MLLHAREVGNEARAGGRGGARAGRRGERPGREGGAARVGGHGGAERDGAAFLLCGDGGGGTESVEHGGEVEPRRGGAAEPCDGGFGRRRQAEGGAERAEAGRGKEAVCIGVSEVETLEVAEEDGAADGAGVARGEVRARRPREERVAPRLRAAAAAATDAVAFSAGGERLGAVGAEGALVGKDAAALSVGGGFGHAARQGPGEAKREPSTGEVRLDGEFRNL